MFSVFLALFSKVLPDLDESESFVNALCPRAKLTLRNVIVVVSEPMIAITSIVRADSAIIGFV